MMKKLLYLIAILGLFACSSGGEKKTESSAKSAEYVETTLNIGGMHCEGCVTSIEKGINGLEGIENVVVSLNDSTARVKYDAAKQDLATIEKAVGKRGYRVKSTE